MAAALYYPSFVHLAGRQPQPYTAAFTSLNLSINATRVAIAELNESDGLSLNAAKLQRVTLNLTKNALQTTGRAWLQHVAQDHLPQEYGELVLADTTKLAQLHDSVSSSPLTKFSDVTYTALYTTIPANLSIFLVTEIFDIIESVASKPKLQSKPSDSLVKKTVVNVRHLLLAVVIGAVATGVGSFTSPFMMAVLAEAGQALPYIIM